MKTKLLFIISVLLAIGGNLFAQSPLTVEGTFNGITQHWTSGAAINRGQIVKLNSSGQAVPMATTDTAGVLGVAVTSVNASGFDVLVSLGGSPLVQTDGACNVGDFVLISSTTAGLGHCSSSASGQVVGTAIQKLSTNGFINTQLSPLSSSAGGGGNVSSLSAALGTTIINPMDDVYGVKADVVRQGNCSWTAGSNPTTVTCPDGLFTSNMTGKGCQGVNGATYLAAAFGTFTYISSTQGTCSGGTGVGSPSGTAQFAVGTDDTAAWQAVGTALLALQHCGTVLIPSGLSFLGAATGNSHKTGCTTSPGTFNGGAVGTSVRGQGRSTSILIMREGFDFSGCVASLGCFMQGGDNGTEYKWFSFDGMDASLSGINPSPANRWMTVTNAGGLQDVGFLSWATAVSPMFDVFDCQAQGGYCENYQIDFFANSSISNTSAGGVTRNAFNDGKYTCGAGICYDFGSFIGAGAASIGTNNNSIMITFAANTVAYFTNTNLQGIGSNSAAIICPTGCIANLDGFQGNPGSMGGTSIGLDITGGTINLKNSLIAGGSGGAVAGTGTLVNYGNNTSAAGTWSPFTGTYVDKTGTFTGAKCTGVATASQTLGLYNTGPNVTLTTCTSTTIGSGIVMSKAGTILELLAKATAGGVNASSGLVTVIKNGVDQTMVCTIGTGTSCVDGATAHQVTVAKGDLISVKFTTQAAETLAGVSVDLVIW